MFSQPLVLNPESISSPLLSESQSVPGTILNSNQNEIISQFSIEQPVNILYFLDSGQTCKLLFEICEEFKKITNFFTIFAVNNCRLKTSELELKKLIISSGIDQLKLLNRTDSQDHKTLDQLLVDTCKSNHFEWILFQGASSNIQLIMHLEGLGLIQPGVSLFPISKNDNEDRNAAEDKGKEQDKEKKESDFDIEIEKYLSGSPIYRNMTCDTMRKKFKETGKWSLVYKKSKFWKCQEILDS